MMRRWYAAAVATVLMDPTAAPAADPQQLQYRVLALEAKVRAISMARPPAPAPEALGQRVRTLELQVAALQQAITRLENQLAKTNTDAPR